MRRLVASGLLPERAGQPVKVWAHVSLAELRAMDDGSVLQAEWIGEMAIRWAARRAAASQTGSDGAAWLNGQAAGAVSCDATLIPVVTGGIDPAALDDLVALCLHYVGHGPHCGAGHHTSPQPPPTDQALEMLRHAIIGKAVSLVSGPGGLASFLRTRLVGPRLAGPSLPLDVGHSADIPAAIRRAVILRDQHCRWAGGCDQPAAACAPRHPPGRRRGNERGRLRVVLLLPPSRGHPPMGLDRHPQPRRHHHRPQPRRHQNLPQPQPARPG